MRRSVSVFGATSERGDVITTDHKDVVDVRVHPNKSVTYRDSSGITHSVDWEWVSYIPRYN